MSFANNAGGKKSLFAKASNAISTVKKLTVGLTGGIACGKTAVSDFFAELGAHVVDADEISRALTARNGAALPAIRARWGDRVFDANNDLDRPALRQLVFADRAQLQELEAILHPLVRQQMQAEVARAQSYALLSVPLLFEKGFSAYCRYHVVVDIDRKRQLARARLRDDSSARSVVAVMRQQCSRLEKLMRAHFVIDNRADLSATRAQVVQLHQFFQQISAAKHT